MKDWTTSELEGAATEDVVRMLNDYKNQLEATRTQPYSHRNGEIEPPTLHGWYWVEMPYHRDGVGICVPYQWEGYWKVSDEWRCEPDENVFEGHPIYGPIPTPPQE